MNHIFKHKRGARPLTLFVPVSSIIVAAQPRTYRMRDNGWVLLVKVAGRPLPTKP